MSAKNPRVDAYLAQAADWARPILSHVRQLVHAACPEVVETIKWRVPHFERKGILISMPAFKQHCAVIFWNGALIFGGAGKEQRQKLRRITALADLPADKILLGYIRKAAALNEAGVKPPAPPRARRPAPAPPDYFLAALRRNKKALAAYEKMSPSCQREYIEWLVGAKREETRAQRVKTAVEWIAAGKSRNWKYR